MAPWCGRDRSGTTELVLTVPALPSPSPRLLRALVAERGELERHRERLLEDRRRVQARLAELEAALGEIDERAALLDRLAGADARDETPVALRPADARPSQLRGPQIRRAAVKVLLERRDRPQALHYRDWYDAVRAAGYEIAGKDPLAVFLTQLSRSPAVRKGTQNGVYELDRSAPRRLRGRLEELHHELRRLTATPSSTVDLAGIRARRAQLNAEIGQVEKALAEAEELLGPPAGVAVMARGGLEPPSDGL
jgi:chaperonin cofactor prefoldin